MLTFRKNRTLTSLELLPSSSARVPQYTQLRVQLDPVLAHVSIPNPYFSIFGPIFVGSFRAPVLDALCSFFQLRNLLLELWCSAVRCWGLKTSLFQVREARTLLFVGVVAVVCVCFVIGWVVCCCGCMS